MKKPAAKGRQGLSRVESIESIRMESDPGTTDTGTVAAAPEAETESVALASAETTASAETETVATLASDPAIGGEELETIAICEEADSGLEAETATIASEAETPPLALAPMAMTTPAGTVAMAAPEPATSTKGMEKIMKSTEDFIAFGQGNVEAMVKASQIWAAGVQELTKQVAAGAQANFDESVSAFKALSGAKTLKDAIDLQTGFARSAFEKSVTESGKLTDASLKLAEQALAPITARVTAAMDSIVKPA